MAEFFQILNPDGQLADGSKEPDISGQKLLEAYRNAVLTRILDEKMIALHRQGRMGTYASCAGQEATQVGSALALGENDWLFPMYRDLGMMVQMGVKLGDLLNRLFGNADDLSLGRDLPNVFAWRKNRVFSVSVPIASQVCPGVGFALAAKLKHDPLVVLTSFGDGATSSSEFHTSMNFAGVYKAPIVFLCENNQYAISVPVSAQTASRTIAVKARAYGFDGIRVDGNDLLAVYSSVKSAIERARRGEGPTLIECYTYRLGPHSTSDDWKKYRSAQEVEDWRKKDPLLRLRRYLEENRKLWSQDDERELRSSLEAIINSEVQRAEAAPQPEVSSMFEDVFQDKTATLIEQSREEE